MLKKCRSQGLADRKAGNSCICVRLEHPGRGHRPWHSAKMTPGQPSAKAPGPRPPGRALASVLPGPAGLRGTVPHGRGKRGSRFLFPPGRAFSRMPGHSGRGHRPCHSAAPGSGPAGGPKPPASARPAHGGRFSPAGSGAWPLSLPDLPVYRVPSQMGGVNAVRFLFPPEQAKALPPLQWQGAIAPATAQRRDQDPPGAGRALASVSPGPVGLQGTVPLRRGKRAAFPVPAPKCGPMHQAMPGLSGRGHRPCHSAAPGSGPAGGPKPPASARSAHGGRWPAVLRAAQVFADAARRGGRNAGRGPASRPQDQSLSPDRKEFPGRHADSPLSVPCSGVKPDLHTGPRTLFVIWSHRVHGRRCAASAGSRLSSRALAVLEQPSPTQRLGA